METSKFPRRSQTAGKHQECGPNDQKGTACRRHNELFVSKRFKAVEEVTTQVKAVKSDEKTKVKAAVVDEGPPKKGDKTNFPKKGCH
ncbi:peptidyl-prolyl cis-trans isomerase FKBP3-like isoform X5 [Stigmatopora argus]